MAGINDANVFNSVDTGVGDVSATAVTDPILDTSIIAALKGLLLQLQGDGLGTGTPLDTTHHNAAITVANGTIANLEKKKNFILLYIKGIPTSSTINFYASQNGTDFVSIKGVNISTDVVSASTNGTSEIWQIDVVGLDKFMADLSAIVAGSGSLTVTSTAI